MTDTGKIIERIDQLEKELVRLSFVDQDSLLRCLQGHNKCQCSSFNHIIDQITLLERTIGFIRRSLTTFAVILGFIAYEIVIHWVMK